MKSGQWSSEELHELKILLERKLTYAQIAKQLNRKKKSVAGKIWKEGLASRVEKNWSADEVDRLASLKAKGLSFEDIAKLMDRSVSSVKVKFCRVNKSLTCP